MYIISIKKFNNTMKSIGSLFIFFYVIYFFTIVVFYRILRLNLNRTINFIKKPGSNAKSYTIFIIVGSVSQILVRAHVFNESILIMVFVFLMLYIPIKVAYGILVLRYFYLT